MMISATELNNWLELGSEEPETDEKIKLLVKRIKNDFNNYAKSKNVVIEEGDHESLNSAAIGYGEYLYRRTTGSTKEVDVDGSISFGERGYIFPPNVEFALDLFVKSKVSEEYIDNECQVV